MREVKNKEKTIQIVYIGSIVTVAVLILSSFVYSGSVGLETLSPAYVRDVSIDVFAMILCGILIVSLAQNKPWDKQNRSLFRLIFVLCLLFHFDLASSFMEGKPEAAGGILAINTFLFFNETLLIFCFWTYIREELHLDETKLRIANGICKVAVILDLILDLMNLKFGYLFTINASGEYVAGNYQSVAEVTSALIYATAWIVLLWAKEKTKKDRVVLATFLVFPIIASIFSEAMGDFATVFPAYLFSVMLIYINVFADRNRKVAAQQLELDQQRTALMVSQIQPHFLYNVLTTISNLCVTDPEEAEETTVLFSQYLRTNLDSLRNTELVPFSAEMGHIRTYAELEKKRFKEKLNYEFHTSEVGFLVPALGLQPIVENSIKHGIRGKDTPGHLIITSQRVENGYEVIIEDDGIGFDPSAPAPDDGRSHVGMANVKSRLAHMCGAQVTVESSPGCGCKTTVFFPESGQPQK